MISGGRDGEGAADLTSSAAFTCSCSCCGRDSLSSATCLHSMWRKLDEVEDEPSATCREGCGDEGVARVEIENEAVALRETLVSHQESIQELYTELEEERNASASAASEAMSMILRLQREKAEIEMEARQFKRLAEEKMTHDQEEISALDDLIAKREQAIESLSCEVQAYRHRLLSYGIDPNTGYDIASEPVPLETYTAANAVSSFSQFDLPLYDYPPLRCAIPEEDATTDIYKYPFGETPREHLQKIEQRIHELERMPSSSLHGNIMDKAVIGYSPRRSKHLRSFSYGTAAADSFGSGHEFSKGQGFSMTVDRISEYGEGDDMSDRVYTVDAVHGAATDYMSTPREAKRVSVSGSCNEEAEIHKLYMRLQALEADRESMRQAMISMSTDKAQMLLLKEIAQQLRKDVTPKKSRRVKKESFLKRFSTIWVVKCLLSFVFWRKKPSRIKYNFGLSSANVGLLLLLDQSPQLRLRSYLSKTQK